MKKADLLLSVFAFTLCLSARAQSDTDGSSRRQQCAHLMNLRIPNLTISVATYLRSGRFRPAESSSTFATPPFCRVVAIARPTSDSVIRLEVWIPADEKWNHRLLGVGNGGYSGDISYASMANALQRHFAAASTDTGHRGENLSFGSGHPEKIVDWGYRSVHVMTESAKLIIRDYSGAFPTASYFDGCSTGGEQALSEVQRFPADYDGVLAGDPGNDRVHLNVGFLWAFMASHSANGDPILRTSVLPLIHKAAVAACDSQDGIEDGIISEPQACRFDPGTLLCNGEEKDDCLTAGEVEAVKKIYAGPRNPRTGEQIIAGYAPGSESPDGEDANGGWKDTITERDEPMRLSFWRLWLFNDPAWDWHTFDFDHDITYADAKLAAVNASNTDLSAFKARGGKIIMYSGWADPIGPPLDAINYYEGVQKALGRDKTESFFRLFMVPGMRHCLGGTGPNNFGDVTNTSAQLPVLHPDNDVLNALSQWVEQGSAPNSIIATHLDGDTPDRSRPLCPYPEVARWNGRGNTDDAKNFVCAEPDAAISMIPMKK